MVFHFLLYIDPEIFKTSLKKGLPKATGNFMTKSMKDCQPYGFRKLIYV
jgi:hypothetical protein